MNKLLLSYNIMEYAAEDCKAIEAFSQSLYDIVKEALRNKLINTLLDDLTCIAERYERVSNILDIHNENNSKCFYFGYITALSSLGVDLAQSDTEDFQMQDLLSSYPLLLPTLEIISRYDTISGVSLKKETGQKSSSISNFMHRIEPYELIDVSKVGTINYYSLTRKGRRLLSQYHQKFQEPSNEPKVPEELVLLILDELATQIAKDKPSSIPVLRRVNSSVPDFGEKKLLKYKIDTVFLRRDLYMRKFLGSCAVAARDDFDIEEYEDWNDHYLMAKENDFVKLTEASYV